MSFQLITLVPLWNHTTDSVCLSFQIGNSPFNREEIGSHYPQYISLFDGHRFPISAHRPPHPRNVPQWDASLPCSDPCPATSLVDDFSSTPSGSLCIFLFNFCLIWIYNICSLFKIPKDMKEFAVKSWSSFHFSPHTLGSLPQRSLQFPAVFLVSDGLCELECAQRHLHHTPYLTACHVVCTLLSSFNTVSYQYYRAVSIFLMITQYSIAWMYHNHLTCPLLMEI